MNTATNPRTTTPNTTHCGNDENDNSSSVSGAARTGGGEDTDFDTAFNSTHVPDLDRRTLAQQRLDGLVGASKAALAAGTLPSTGGLRPQVMVTVSYKDLLNSIETTAAQGPRYNRNPTTTRPSPTPTNDTRQTTTNHPTDPSGWEASGPALLLGTWQISDPEPPATTPPDTRQPSTPEASFFGTLPGTPTGSGTFTYTGPVTASTIRKIACDADIIPILLGTEGRILDIGRTTRVFPPHIRKALHARDQGCAFPNCTIPAPWCEAHHITYWSTGGPTSTDNGVLLCTHHHHLIHKEQWKIHVKNGVPWFIPPPHIDPRQQPRQNHHHKT